MLAKALPGTSRALELELLQMAVHTLVVLLLHLPAPARTPAPVSQPDRQPRQLHVVPRGRRAARHARAPPRLPPGGASTFWERQSARAPG